MALQEYIVRHETKRRKAEHVERAKMRRWFGWTKCLTQNQ
jgi:hypothetical protein